MTNMPSITATLKDTRRLKTMTSSTPNVTSMSNGVTLRGSVISGVTSGRSARHARRTLSADGSSIVPPKSVTRSSASGSTPTPPGKTSTIPVKNRPPLGKAVQQNRTSKSSIPTAPGSPSTPRSGIARMRDGRRSSSAGRPLSAGSLPSKTAMTSSRRGSDACLHVNPGVSGVARSTSNVPSSPRSTTIPRRRPLYKSTDADTSLHRRSLDSIPNHTNSNVNNNNITKQNRLIAKSKSTADVTECGRTRLQSSGVTLRRHASDASKVNRSTHILTELPLHSNTTLPKGFHLHQKHLDGPTSRGHVPLSSAKRTAHPGSGGGVVPITGATLTISSSLPSSRGATSPQQPTRSGMSEESVRGVSSRDATSPVCCVSVTPAASSHQQSFSQQSSPSMASVEPHQEVHLLSPRHAQLKNVTSAGSWSPVISRRHGDRDDANNNSINKTHTVPTHNGFISNNNGAHITHVNSTHCTGGRTTGGAPTGGGGLTTSTAPVRGGSPARFGAMLVSSTSNNNHHHASPMSSSSSSSSNNNTITYSNSQNAAAYNLSAEVESDLTERLLLEPVRDFDRINSQFSCANGLDTDVLSPPADPARTRREGVQVDVHGGYLTDDVTRESWPTPEQQNTYRQEQDSGQEVQRVSVITNLPQLLQDSNEDCMRRVVPKVREVLHVADTEMQLAACNAFVDILGKQLVPLQHYAQTFLKSIITGLDNKDTDIANAWLDTLLDVMDILPKDMIKKEILGMAISKGQLQQSVHSRQAACKILGKIATKFEPFVLKTEIVPVVDSLCQDVDYEVRACMCRHLNPVARGLGLEQTKVSILPALVELTNDEESCVRLAGLETVVLILSLLDEDTRVSTIIPLVTKLCHNSLKHDDPTLSSVAYHIGQICHGLKGSMVEDERKNFLDFYRKLCQKGLTASGAASGNTKSTTASHNVPSPSTSPDDQDFFFPADFFEKPDSDVECRTNAAYNFPAMFLLIGPRHFRSELFPTFIKLCSDPHHSVRRTAAAGLHEVMKLLGANAVILQATLISLLTDEHLEVLRGLLPNLPSCLEVLSNAVPHNSSDTKALQTIFEELLPALMKCDHVVSSSNNWRLQSQLMEALSCLPKCYKGIPNDVVYKAIVPVLTQRIHTARALPVKHSACKTLLTIMRHARKLEQRQYICTQLIQDLCRSGSSFQRKLFIDTCSFAMELFSNAFFKDHFFYPLLSLCKDSVPNVRLRVCSLLPKLKSQIRLPSDRAMLQELEAVARRVHRYERDPDVLEIIEKAVSEMDDYSVHLHLSTKVDTEEEILDKRKEEEENYLIELEERDKREDERNKKEKKDSKIPAMRAAKGKSSATRDKGSASSTLGREKNGGVANTTAASKKNPNSISSPTKTTRTSTRPTGSASSSSTRKGSANSLSSVSSSATSLNPAVPKVRRSSTDERATKDLKTNSTAKTLRTNVRGVRACPTPNI